LTTSYILFFYYKPPKPITCPLHTSTLKKKESNDIKRCKTPKLERTHKKRYGGPLCKALNSKLRTSKTTYTKSILKNKPTCPTFYNKVEGIHQENA
jgi:hypothetical protein